MKEKYLKQKLEQAGIADNPAALIFFTFYYEKLSAWNQHTNLTRITTFEDFTDKHIIDSLQCLKVLDEAGKSQNLRLIDLGTGAGFPLLPMWFYHQHWHITLLDAVNKKLLFLENLLAEAVKQGIVKNTSNIRMIHERAEDLARQEGHRATYDLVVNRAVASLVVLAELSLPFLKEGGICVVMKKGDLKQEIEDARFALKLLGGEITSVEKYQLPGLPDDQRVLIILKKVKKTPDKYPRNPGIIKKKPLMANK